MNIEPKNHVYKLAQDDTFFNIALLFCKKTFSSVK